MRTARYIVEVRAQLSRQHRRTVVSILFVAAACVGYVLAVGADSWLRYVCIGLASGLATFAQESHRKARQLRAIIRDLERQQN